MVLLGGKSIGNAFSIHFLIEIMNSADIIPWEGDSQYKSTRILVLTREWWFYLLVFWFLWSFGLCAYDSIIPLGVLAPGHCDPGRLQNTCDHSIGTDSVIIHSIIMFNLFDVSRSRKFGKTPSVRVRNQEGAGVRFHLELGFGRGGNESTLLIICFFAVSARRLAV